MNLFISYSSTDRDLCERLRLALEAEGHSVFVDRTELKEGEAYNAALRSAVSEADALIFLVSPRSVAPGSYALTELDFAQRHWRRPAGHVLPVLVEPTPIGSIPPYLRTVTLLQPKGDTVAETVAAVTRLRAGPRRRLLVAGLAGVLLLAAIGAFLANRYQAEQAQRRAEAAQHEALLREIKVASELCQVGSHAVAWQQFERLAQRAPDEVTLRTAREDCGMLWLREMHVASDKETFGELVDKVQPVLAAGIAASSGSRSADLRAHLGWADFLRSRDGVVAPKSLPQYEAALRDDPGNVYANAMWAHNRVWETGQVDPQARRHFEAAVAGGRDRAYVRRLQFASALGRRDQRPYAMAVADAMRRSGESLGEDMREQLWRYAVDGPFLMAQERASMLAALPGADFLATFEWLFPAATLRDDRRPLWRFCRAAMRAQAGDQAQATAELEALQRDLRSAGDDSSVMRETGALLGQWRKAH